MKTAMSRKWRVGVGLLVASLLTPALLWAQDGSPTTSQDPNADAQDAGTNPDTSSDAGKPPIPAYVAGGNNVQQLGRANPLGEGGSLAWGPFSVRDAEFSQYYGNTTFYNVPGPVPSQSVTASVFSSTLAFEEKFNHNSLALQYAPTMFVDNGTFTYDATQRSALNMLFVLNERWGLSVKNDFSYYASQRVLTDLGLDFDYETQSTVENNILDGPGSSLFNATGAEFSYLWSPRTTVSFGPSYVYERSTGALVSGLFAGAVTTANYEGGDILVSHMLSESSRIGVSYLGQYSTLNTNSATVVSPQSGSEVLQQIAASYNRDLAPTWRLDLGVGAVLGSGSGSGGNGLEIDAGITKTFQRAEFAATFEQGRSFNGFISNQITDRVNGLVRYYLTHRFIAAGEVSYFTTTGAGPGYSGMYTTTQLTYQMAPHVSVIGVGSYIQQTGDGVFVLNANRYLLSLGLRWEAALPSNIR